MTMLPTTVGELRRFLETYPDDLEIFIQGNTVENPNATPDHFVVEYWGPPSTKPAMLLLAGVYNDHYKALGGKDNG